MFDKTRTLKCSNQSELTCHTVIEFVRIYPHFTLITVFVSVIWIFFVWAVVIGDSALFKKPLLALVLFLDAKNQSAILLV